MLVERDRRSGKIEIRNAENEGDCTDHFGFLSGPGFDADGVQLLPPQECRRADEPTQRCRAAREESTGAGEGRRPAGGRWVPYADRMDPAGDEYVAVNRDV